MLLNPISGYNDLLCSFGDGVFEYDEILRQGAISFNSISIPLAQLFFAQQIHADGISFIVGEDAGNTCRQEPNIIPQVYALHTDQHNLFLCVKYADCIPVLLFDPQKKAIAGIHSGRNGSEMNITGKTLSAMQKHYNTDTSGIQAVLGPSICQQHYEVSEEVFNRFVTETGIKQNYPLLDLKKVVKQQLIDSGVKSANIRDVSICTYEDDTFYSYRRNGTQKRQIAFIGLING